MEGDYCQIYFSDNDYCLSAVNWETMIPYVAGMQCRARFPFLYSIGVHNKLLMTDPKANSEFCFPETPNVPQGEAKGNIEC